MGVLTELNVAFSRDGKEKDYVQHHLMRKAKLVSPFFSIDPGAEGVAYVCGDAKHMAQVCPSLGKYICLLQASCALIRAKKITTSYLQA